MGKVFYVLRGLQGTGKSTVAHEIVSESGTQNTLIASTDDYFMVDGEYIFNPEKLGEYHQANYNRCVQFFENMETADDAVCILDNTNVEHWHYEPYVEKAEQYGFEVRIVVFAIDSAAVCRADSFSWGVLRPGKTSLGRAALAAAICIKLTSSP